MEYTVSDRLKFLGVPHNKRIIIKRRGKLSILQYMISEVEILILCFLFLLLCGVPKGIKIGMSDIAVSIYKLICIVSCSADTHKYQQKNIDISNSIKKIEILIKIYFNKKIC